MGAQIQTGRSNKRRLNADINVVPYIDVMLVLLIIFMVTAPLMTQGIDVELPDAEAESMTVPEDPPTLAIHADGTYRILQGENASDVLDDAMLETRVAELMAAKPGQMLLVQGDAKVPYERVANGMAIIRRAGATKIGFITEEPAEKR